MAQLIETVESTLNPLSPGIREQHDEFPLIADPEGRTIVRQFGLSVQDFLANFSGTIEEGDVLMTSDPCSCGAAISHTNACHPMTSSPRPPRFCRLPGLPACRCSTPGPGSTTSSTGGVFLRKVPALRLLIRPAPGEDPPMGEPMPEVAPAPGEALPVKQPASPILGTNLAALLQEAEVDGREQAVHQATLYDLQAKYAEVMDSSTLGWSTDQLSRGH